MIEWETPRGLFEAVAASYGPFTLDVAASPGNAKCERFLSLEDDGLAHSWAGERVWMNPPYGGRRVRPWLEKARLEAAAGATVVALVPFAPDTAWWLELVDGAGAEVRAVRGRVRFVGSPGSAPFASALVVYRPPLVAQPRRPAPEPAVPSTFNLELFPGASGPAPGAPPPPELFGIPLEVGDGPPGSRILFASAGRVLGSLENVGAPE